VALRGLLLGAHFWHLTLGGLGFTELHRTSPNFTQLRRTFTEDARSPPRTALAQSARRSSTVSSPWLWYHISQDRGDGQSAPA